MPDPFVMSKAFTVALVLAMATVFAFRRLFHATDLLLGLAMGTFAGLWILNLLPHVPPHDVLDRLLVIILPTAVIAELLAAASCKLGWVARGVLAVFTLPVILHGSTFVTDLSGPGSREWSSQKSSIIYAVGALALLVVWATTNRLAVRASHGVMLWIVAGDLQATGVTIMLSGYATGGQLSIPLAASLVGIGIASSGRENNRNTATAIGVGIVALFALLVVARLFAGLKDINAALLMVSPLLAWLPECIPASPRVRTVLQLTFAAAPAIVALVLAQHKFAAGYLDGPVSQSVSSIADHAN